ncbi:MAG TPA: hypothetical protein G4N92_09505 [Anaerolineae bacterium]|nr:hypothetical protein [Anaerolineae bacterium]
MKINAVCFYLVIFCLVSCVNLNLQPQEDYPPTPSLIPPATTSTVPPTSPPVCNLQSEFKPEWETVFCDQFNDNYHNWVISQEATELSHGNAPLDLKKRII